MKIEGFPYEFIICGQDKTPVSDATGYVGLAHGEQYYLQLKNDGYQRAKVTVTADGVEIGTWVIPAEFDGKTLIERPTESQKRLTFFRAGSEEAAAALLDTVPADKLGVIQASFVRELPERQPVTHGWPDSLAFREATKGGLPANFGVLRMRGFGAGGTGLTGASDQIFGRTYFREDSDFKPVVVSLRLAHDPDRKLGLDVQPLEGHRPRQNSVPAPIGAANGP